MTVVVREHVQSRGVSSSNTGREIGYRLFKVYDNGIAPVANLNSPAAIRHLFGTNTTPDAMPKREQAFPDFAALLASDYSIDLDDASKNIWTVRWDYENVQPFLEWTMTRKKEFVDFWRKGAEGSPLSMPPNGNLGDNLNWEVEGVPHDIAGEPQSYPVFQQTLELTQIVIGNSFTLADEVQSPTSIIAESTQRFATFVGTRNSATFYGCAAGRLLYVGAQSKRMALNRIAITHQFVWDEFFHMRQVPLRDITNIVQNTETLVEETDLIPHAEKVYWRQPFPDLSNFNDLMIEQGGTGP